MAPLAFFAVVRIAAENTPRRFDCAHSCGFDDGRRRWCAQTSTFPRLSSVKDAAASPNERRRFARRSSPTAANGSAVIWRRRRPAARSWSRKKGDDQQIWRLTGARQSAASHNEPLQCANVSCERKAAASQRARREQSDARRLSGCENKQTKNVCQKKMRVATNFGGDDRGRGKNSGYFLLIAALAKRARPDKKLQMAAACRQIDAQRAQVAEARATIKTAYLRWQRQQAQVYARQVAVAAAASSVARCAIASSVRIIGARAAQQAARRLLSSSSARARGSSQCADATPRQWRRSWERRSRAHAPLDESRRFIENSIASSLRRARAHEHCRPHSLPAVFIFRDVKKVAYAQTKRYQQCETNKEENQPANAQRCETAKNGGGGDDDQERRSMSLGSMASFRPAYSSSTSISSSSAVNSSSSRTSTSALESSAAWLKAAC